MPGVGKVRRQGGGGVQNRCLPIGSNPYQIATRAMERLITRQKVERIGSLAQRSSIKLDVRCYNNVYIFIYRSISCCIVCMYSIYIYIYIIIFYGDLAFYYVFIVTLMITIVISVLLLSLLLTTVFNMIHPLLCVDVTILVRRKCLCLVSILLSSPCLRKTKRACRPCPVAACCSACVPGSLVSTSAHTSEHTWSLLVEAVGVLHCTTGAIRSSTQVYIN